MKSNKSHKKTRKNILNKNEKKSFNLYRKKIINQLENIKKS
jgi:hypothetical protein